MIFGAILGAILGVFAGPILLRRALQWNPERLATTEGRITLAGFPILGGATTFLLFRMYTSDGARAVCAALWAVGVLVAALDMRGRRPDASKALSSVGTILAGGVLLLECVMGSAAYGLPTAYFPGAWADLAGSRAAGAVVGALSNPDPEVRRTALDRLSQMGMDHNGFPAGSNRGYRKFPQSLRPFTPALSRAISDPNTDVRASAITAITGNDDPRAVAALTRGLNDPDARLASAAQLALIQLQKPETVLPVLRSVALRLRSHMQTQYTTGDMARGLQITLQTQNLFSAWAVPALIQAATDSDPEVRGVAAHEIGRLATAEGQRTLVALAKDRDPAVRAAAMEGMGLASHRQWQAMTLAALLRGDATVPSSSESILTDDQLGVDVLSNGMVDPDAQVRLSAVKAFQQAAKTDFSSNTDEFDANIPESRMQPLKLDQAQQRLLKLLRDPNAEVVNQASQTMISQRFGMSAVPALLQAAENREDERLSRSATYAICSIKDRRIIPVLRAHHEALFQHEAVCEVCAALYRFGERTGMPHRFEVRE
jgi:HEAT repeat protein